MRVANVDRWAVCRFGERPRADQIYVDAFARIFFMCVTLTFVVHAFRGRRRGIGFRRLGFGIRKVNLTANGVVASRYWSYMQHRFCSPAITIDGVGEIL
jgi:hypothetical protein